MTSQPTLELLDVLLAQVCRLHHERASVRLRALGLYRGQPSLLFRLHEQDGQTLTDLATQLGVAPATITKMTQRMERAGFLERRPDAEDQRVSRVYLTEAGRAVQVEMMAAIRHIADETFADVAPEEYALLERLFRQMIASLSRAAQEKLADSYNDW
ncbi:MAG TPA: MarR family transcriptional regulator [Roseiflexaceae bacterium]|nr:MarR family transcriptional regulator [Roseiflexaceae bacterium]